jgi:hypothetical protein
LDISAVEEAAGDPDVMDNEGLDDMSAIRPEEEENVVGAKEEQKVLETDDVEAPTEFADANIKILCQIIMKWLYRILMSHLVMFIIWKREGLPSNIKIMQKKR